jgi:hypothetical protein
MCIESAGQSYLKISSQIIGGKPVPQAQIPWTVYIIVDNTYLCGGTLLSADWVLTAAYCVKGLETKYQHFNFGFFSTCLFAALNPLWWPRVAWIGRPTRRAKSFESPPRPNTTKITPATI